MVVWDSNLYWKDECGLKFSNRSLDILENKVSYKDLSRLLIKGFVGNEPNFKCWKAGSLLCRCGKWKTPPGIIFSGKEMEICFTDILNREIFDRSLIALISCNNDISIMVLVFFCKQKNQHFSALLMTEELILSFRNCYSVIIWNIYLWKQVNKSFSLSVYNFLRSL